MERGDGQWGRGKRGRVTVGARRALGAVGAGVVGLSLVAVGPAVAQGRLGASAPAVPAAVSATAVVPAGFVARSASFVSSLDGFVLGQSCGAARCSMLAATTDAGWSWTRRPGPPVPAGRLSGLRFGSAEVGFAYGPRILEATTNGGATWAAVRYPGQGAGSVLDEVGVGGGQVFALTSGPGGRVVQVSRRPLGSGSWAPVPGATLPGPGGGSPELAVGDGDGYVLSGNTVAGGPLRGPWVSHPMPCPVGFRFGAQMAVDGPRSLDVVCEGPGRAGRFPKRAYSTLDGGATFLPDGYGPSAVPPAEGSVRAVASSGSYQSFMATTAGATSIYTLDGARWQKVFGPVGAGQAVADFGFIDDAQGLLVLASPTPRRGPGAGVYLTRDAGATWQRVDFTVSSLAARCRPDQLRLSEDGGVAALGHVTSDFLLTDVGAPCSLEGYPGVSLTAPGGRRTVALPSDASFIVRPRPEIPAVLSAGQPATFFLSSTDIAAVGHGCVAFSQVAVVPPGSRASLPLRTSNLLCRLPPIVSFVVPGRQDPRLGS